MFARFNENPEMTLQDIKETKRYGRKDGRMDGRENSIPPTNKVCGGYNYYRMLQGEHSAILLTIKLPFVIKIFVLSIFEWLFLTGFTVPPCAAALATSSPKPN